MRLLDKLISSLRTTPEDSQTLIDRTMVLYGSNMGNGSPQVVDREWFGGGLA